MFLCFLVLLFLAYVHCLSLYYIISILGTEVMPYIAFPRYMSYISLQGTCHNGQTKVTQDLIKKHLEVGVV